MRPPPPPSSPSPKHWPTCETRAWVAMTTRTRRWYSALVCLQPRQMQKKFPSYFFRHSSTQRRRDIKYHFIDTSVSTTRPTKNIPKTTENPCGRARMLKTRDVYRTLRNTCTYFNRQAAIYWWTWHCKCNVKQHAKFRLFCRDGISVQCTRTKRKEIWQAHQKQVSKVFTDLSGPIAPLATC